MTAGFDEPVSSANDGSSTEGRFSPGRHCLLELGGCPAETLSDPAWLEHVLREAARAAGAHVIGALRHHFATQGVSVVCLLAESHISIHTWPESGHATADVYTCGTQCDPEQACQVLIDRLGAQQHRLRVIPREAPDEIPTDSAAHTARH